MSKYLEPTDEGAFEDHTLLDPLKAYELGMTVLCPQCKGHGGWNLTLNAYPLHGKADTPENRYKFSHFRASCSHCMGWGYVEPKNAYHVHHWVHDRNIGNCLNVLKCSDCGLEWQVDSSD